MPAWLFARGRAALQVLDAPRPAGAAQFTLPDADQSFALGQQLFISGADGSDVQWLGRVDAVDADSLSCAIPLRGDKSPGALLWRAVDWHAVQAVAALPERLQLDLGTRCERSLSGDCFAIQLAAPQSTLRLRLAGLVPAGERRLVDWLLSATQLGLLPFTLIPAGGALFSARLADEPIERVVEKGDRLSLALPLTSVEHGKFQ